MFNQQRIVITGMGLVSPLGLGVEQVWARLVNGESGIRHLPETLAKKVKASVAGLVPSHTEQPNGLNESNYVTPKERKRIDKFTLFALAAAQEALQQAGWQADTPAKQETTATIIATGIGGLQTITHAQGVLDQQGARRLSPFTVPAFLANLAAGNITIKYGFKGPIGTPVTACAAGIQAIGDAMRLIRSQETNIALAGGSEAGIDPLSLAGFGALKALSTDQEPATASRPFDRDRNGFIMGEGAGLVVLETLEHALSRGATPLVEIVGYGTSADAYHLTAGPENGEGAARAIQTALTMAKLQPNEINHINAHATSTQVGDHGEVNALRRIFGDALTNIPISATKSSTGHLLGAAGGIEAIFSAQALLTDTLPPTLNLINVDPQLADLDFTPLVSRHAEISHVLCNGFGFGGVNAAIILKKYNE